MVSSPRPPLPVRHANPNISTTLKSGSLPPVKYQVLNCQGQDILVGRLKIETPTPSGHAFILRRFDTGAISLTTMFRAAFPNAPDHEEKVELQWVKDNFDLSGNNGGPQNPSITRLAGTWVNPSLAQTLGKAYSLGDLINTVIEARPDPNASYRRSAKSNPTPTKHVPDSPSTKPVSASNAAATLPTPSPTGAQPNPPKRRKETTPIPAPTPPTSPTKIPRRKSRTRSPAPRSAVISPLTTVTRTTARVTRSSRREEKIEETEPEAPEIINVDDESVIVEDGVAGSQLHEQDIAEQRALVEKLKAQKQARDMAAEKADEADDGGEEVSTEPNNAAGIKRARVDEDEELKTIQFIPKEPEIGERAIATNNRVGRFELQPTTRRLAWGAAAFAFGSVAAAFLPNFL